MSPNTLSVCEIKDGLRFCKIKQEEARKRAVQSRDELMRHGLACSNENDDRKQVSRIKQMTSTEKSKKHWSITNTTVNDTR